MSSCDPMCLIVSWFFMIFYEGLGPWWGRQFLEVHDAELPLWYFLGSQDHPQFASALCTQPGYFNLLRINTVNRTKFYHLLSPRSWEARSKSHHILEATTELYTQNILSHSGGTWCNIASLSCMQSCKQCPEWFERKNSVSSRGSRAPGFALRWNIQV